MPISTSTVTLAEFCERLIEYRQGDVENALRDYFHLLGQRDRDACHIGGTHASDEVKAELTRAAQGYRDSHAA